MSTPTSRFKSTAEIREAFLKFFEKNGHTRVASGSLVPANDPTLLFTNAGMNQFKDAFLGVEKRPYTRATSAQKCVRAGGKHNDLENVGFTARHHTFFEMLGNFSFGDYFKKEAIRLAWEFVTKELGLPRDRLRVSVHISDDEAAEIWHKQEGVPLDRIVRFDADNFWQMGDTGPCGPCSEIFWDQGKEVDGDRWLEFWNCVFMQYNRSADGTLTPLPKPSVDTGMGLERIATILQDTPSNYEIDLLAVLIKATQEKASEMAGRRIGYDSTLASSSGFNESAALRVIVDHLRSTSFLIADGVLPSNEGRGYVLRRILRRAVRYAKRLGVERPILCELFPALEAAMGDAYPELRARRQVVMQVLREEEERFYETLNRGLELLDESFARLGSAKQLPAEVVFKLYDTFGFPMDLTALIARERNLAIDEAGFERLMQAQQEKSRASWKGSGETAISDEVKGWKNQQIYPRFTGYDALVEKARVLAVAPTAGRGVWVAIDPCPFYGEGGGQMGDRGTLELASGKVLKVLDSSKPYEDGIALFVEEGDRELVAGVEVKASVDEALRRATRANHTATHLLHAALRKFLGPHVAQAGSLVNDQKLRFDFSHNKSITAEELKRIEDWVNDAIERDVALGTEVTGYDDAVKKGAIALFGEKYGDRVRMVAVPGLSTELCGGTHVRSTGDIRQFKITSEGAVAAGTRRIEAITGRGVIEWYARQEQRLRQVADTLKTPADALLARVEKMLDRQRELENEIKKLQQKLIQGGGAEAGAELKATYRGLPFIVHALEGADANLLRQKADAVRKADPASIHVVVSGALLLVTLDPQRLKDQHAGNILKELSGALGGRGGGQAQTAQGQIPPDTQPDRIVKWAGEK